MSKDTVVNERWKFIGGSDIPIIMNISPFKRRWQLLQEKAQIASNEFTGNEYTEYGDEMEPKIRDFVNECLKKNFVPDCLIKDDVRCNVDGYNLDTNEILEIKTTSQIKDNVNDYKVYLVQLLFYMCEYRADKGYLAVYERPDDFDTEFNPLACTIYMIDRLDYQDLIKDIYYHVDRFREDLKKVIANPFLTEEELLPNDIVSIANQIVELEEKLAMAKQIEDEAKEFKARLFKEMLENGIEKWETVNGVKFTLVQPGEDKFVQEFNVEAFKEAEPDLYEDFLENKVKKGRSGYVKITFAKGGK